MAYKHTCIACGHPCGYTGILNSADCSNPACRYYVAEQTKSLDEKYEPVYRIFRAAERFRNAPKCTMGHTDFPSWCPECNEDERLGEELFDLIQKELGVKDA